METETYVQGPYGSQFDNDTKSRHEEDSLSDIQDKGVAFNSQARLTSPESRL
jgi:hypothetical protein